MTAEEFVQAYRELVDKIEREGGEISIDLGDYRKRTIHFPSGISRDLINERIVNTVEALVTWKK